MRVPIYRADLSAKSGFKRIARKLKSKWPGDTPLSLSTAYEVLARGLGYRDFHDVIRSSEKCEPNAPTPTQAEVRDGISTSIFAFLQASNANVSYEGTLDHLAMLLPLHELWVFNNSSQGQYADQSKRAALLPSMRYLREQARPPYDETQRQKASTGDLTSNIQFSSSSKRVVSQDEMESIARAVQRTGKLRDQCLYALMQTGRRANEIRLATVGNPIHVHSSKLRIQEQKFILPTRAADMLARYIKTLGLSEGDYLFSSKHDAKRPMSLYELNKIFHTWLLEAKVQPARMSIHCIRLSVAVLALRAGELSSILGHYPVEMLRYYLTKSNLPSDK